MPRRKVTPFARFLLAMIIIIPLAFAGASYINGEDPISNFKQIVGMEEKAAVLPQKERSSTENKASVEVKTIDELRKENDRLQKELKQRDQAITDLQKELEACQ